MQSKKLALWIFIVGVGSLVSGVLGFIWWDRGALPGFKPDIVDVTVDSVNWNNRGVKISGMARHDIRIKQDIRGTTWHVYPLVPTDDMNAKIISVMVMTTTPPDKRAMIEERTLEGLARPPGRLISPEIYKSWRNAGYEFEDRITLIEEYIDSD